MNKYIKITILVLLSLILSWRLFRPGYPSMQDDIQVFRLQQYDQCLKDGQIPCRYIADGGLGYGYPLFNFYSPLPYAIAETAHLTGFSYINSIKIAFIIPTFLRVFGMYLLSSVFFGASGGIISATLYALAPYQAVNSYVRGAIGETWALSLIPLVFWSLYQKRNRLSVLFLSLLMLSHNLTLLYAIPLLFIFSVITQRFKYFIRTFSWSLLICASFLLPAFFEKNLTTVSTMTQGYFNYIIHFVTLKELFVSNIWGYSASMWGPIDGLSFNIGIFQWLIPTVLFVSLFFIKKIKHSFLIIPFYLIGVFALFLSHNKSTFLWQILPLMAYFQFPWRFLGLAVFCFSFLSGGFILLFKKDIKFSILFSLILLVSFINYPYFREDLWYPSLTDSQKLNSVETMRQSGAGLMDYWPKYGQNYPTSFAPSIPTVLSGEIDFIKYYKNSHYSEAYLSVSSESAIVNLPIVYFPNWDLNIDGQPAEYEIDPELGLIQLEFTQGEHHYQLKFADTPIRKIANTLSLLTLISFIILTIREKHL